MKVLKKLMKTKYGKIKKQLDKKKDEKVLSAVHLPALNILAARPVHQNEKEKTDIEMAEQINKKDEALKSYMNIYFQADGNKSPFALESPSEVKMMFNPNSIYSNNNKVV